MIINKKESKRMQEDHIGKMRQNASFTQHRQSEGIRASSKGV